MHDMHAVNREEEPEAGFTLIELMVVVLIIAILIAVMIPTFVGARRRAQDRGTQSSLRNGLTTAKVIFSDHGDFTLATPAELDAAEPSVAWFDAATASTGPNSISVDPATADYIAIAGLSRSGSCFFVSDDESVAGAGVQFAKTAGGTCNAGSAPAAGDPAWASTW